jgi:type VI secretion system protein ImpA
MPLPTLDLLLAPVSVAEPCGPDLEYSDPAFAELIRATQQMPELKEGEKVLRKAQGPDWRAVTRYGIELLARTKDLRVCVHLTKAFIHTDGIQGLARGGALLAAVVQTYWDGVHPRLDPEDGNDPTMRKDVLSTLTAWDVTSAIRSMPLVTSRLGRISFKDVEAALAKGNGAGDPSLQAAAKDCDLDVLQADAAAAVAALTALKELDATLSLANFSGLLSLVQKIVDFFQVTLARRVPAANDVPSDAGTVREIPMTSSAPGEIGSREDVLRALDRISAYYKDNEPSSPIPLFIERCRRLVTMSFLDIVRDLVPDAVKQVEVLKGRTE